MRSADGAAPPGTVAAAAAAATAKGVVETSPAHAAAVAVPPAPSKGGTHAGRTASVPSRLGLYGTPRLPPSRPAPSPGADLGVRERLCEAILRALSTIVAVGLVAARVGDGAPSGGVRGGAAGGPAYPSFPTVVRCLPGAVGKGRSAAAGSGEVALIRTVGVRRLVDALTGMAPHLGVGEGVRMTDLPVFRGVNADLFGVLEPLLELWLPLEVAAAGDWSGRGDGDGDDASAAAAAAAAGAGAMGNAGLSAADAVQMVGLGWFLALHCAAARPPRRRAAARRGIAGRPGGGRTARATWMARPQGPRGWTDAGKKEQE